MLAKLMILCYYATVASKMNLKDRILVSKYQEHQMKVSGRPVRYNCWLDESMVKAISAVEKGIQ